MYAAASSRPAQNLARITVMPTWLFRRSGSHVPAGRCSGNMPHRVGDGLGIGCAPDQFANLSANPKERVDHLRVPLCAGALSEDFIQSIVGHPLAIGAIALHGIERIGHGRDPREERDLLAGETERITGPVPRFVMMP